MFPPDRGNNWFRGYPDRLSCLRCLSGFFCFLGPWGFIVLLQAVHAADAVVVDLHGLRRMFRPLYLFFVYHDLLNEQPQQFRRQFRDVRIPPRLVEKARRSVYRFPQALNIRLLLGDFRSDSVMETAARISRLRQYRKHLNSFAAARRWSVKDCRASRTAGQIYPVLRTAPVIKRWATVCDTLCGVYHVAHRCRAFMKHSVDNRG